MFKRVAFFVIALLLIAFTAFSAYALLSLREPDCYVGVPGCMVIGAILCDWLMDKFSKF